MRLMHYCSLQRHATWCEPRAIEAPLYSPFNFAESVSGITRSARLARFLLRNLLALFAGFGKSDGNRLLAVRYFLAGPAAFQRAALLLVHRAFDVARGGFGIFASHK